FSIPRAALLFPLVHRRVERCHEVSVDGQLLYSIVVRSECVVVICLVGYSYDCRKAIISLIGLAF
ncbi:hypothetical protein KQ738_16675, partial [Listeria monocytogenes]|nr:hypothetical protein [Listeria monocytogenes]